MARDGTKSGGRDFLPGNTAGALTAMPPELRSLRKLNYESVEQILKWVLDKDLASIQVAARSTTLPAIVVMFAVAAEKGMMGSEKHMKLVMAYAVGLPKVNVKIEDNRNTDRFSHLTDEEIDLKFQQEQQRLLEYGK